MMSLKWNFICASQYFYKVKSKGLKLITNNGHKEKLVTGEWPRKEANLLLMPSSWFYRILHFFLFGRCVVSLNWSWQQTREYLFSVLSTLILTILEEIRNILWFNFSLNGKIQNYGIESWNLPFALVHLLGPTNICLVANLQSLQPF